MLEASKAGMKAGNINPFIRTLLFWDYLTYLHPTLGAL